MGTAMANFRSFGDENLAKAESAAEAEVVKPRGGAVLAEFQKKRDAARRAVARIPPSPLMPPARARMTPADERAQAEIMKVALAQPHRRDEEDPRSTWLATPLGRFCLRTWRRDEKMSDTCFYAGNDYAKGVRAYLVACGHNVPGVGSRQPDAPEIDLDDLSPDERAKVIAAANLVKEAAKAIVDRANEVLIDIMPRLPRAMERLCCTLDEPFPNDGDMLKNGLYRLALHYGMVDRGINSGKEF